MNMKPLMVSFILPSLLLLSLILTHPPTSPLPTPHLTTHPPHHNATFAYLISASAGDAVRLRRLLSALYHPANRYLIHLDAAAPQEEHRRIARFVSATFSAAGNVWIVGRPSIVTYRGPTMLAATLHGVAALLRTAPDWDWFINLSASDYPLITQDDLISAFSELPKDLNFVQHTSHLGWKMNKRAKPIIIDPGLYSENKSEIWWVIKQRTLPTAFKLYTGSAWTILSRSFAEYAVVGWDNFPRTLLLYYTNFVSSPEGYFQTLICNSEKFKNTVINHDLHYISWDNPPKQHPRSLSLKDYRRMVLSNRPFARKFKKDDLVLDRIDRELLKRRSKQFAFGGWCFKDNGREYECNELNAENYGVLRPGSGARRLKVLLKKLIHSRKRQCK